MLQACKDRIVHPPPFPDREERLHDEMQSAVGGHDVIPVYVFSSGIEPSVFRHIG
jgi:hypothetical protein